MFCESCGVNVANETGAYCPNCGERIAVAQTPSRAHPSTYPAKMPGSSGARKPIALTPGHFIIIGAAVLVVIIVIVIFALRGGGGLTGAWEAVTGGVWTERMEINRGGTGRMFEFDQFGMKREDIAFHWERASFGDNEYLIAYIPHPFDPTELEAAIMQFEITTNHFGDRIMTLRDIGGGGYRHMIRAGRR